MASSVNDTETWRGADVSPPTPTVSSAAETESTDDDDDDGDDDADLSPRNLYIEWRNVSMSTPKNANNAKYALCPKKSTTSNSER